MLEEMGHVTVLCELDCATYKVFYRLDSLA